MDLQSNDKLKKALFGIPPGIPLTARFLADAGISRQLVHAYIKGGWLEKLSSGYYKRHNDMITSAGAVLSMEMQGLDVHIGGKSALSHHGFVHYLSSEKPVVYLYGRISKLPKWVDAEFFCEVRKERLFGEPETLSERLYVKRMETGTELSPYVSEPERALLEMLEDVPLRQSLDESRKLMETMFGLRSEIMQDLLIRCCRIKVKRLFVLEAQRLNLPVLKELNLNDIDFGSRSLYIISKKGDSLILKNPLEGIHG